MKYFDSDSHLSRKYYMDYLVGLVVVSAAAEQEVLDSIYGSGKVLMDFSIKNSSVAVSAKYNINMFPFKDKVICLS